MELNAALLGLIVFGHITDEASPLRRLLLKGYAWQRGRAPQDPFPGQPPFDHEAGVVPKALLLPVRPLPGDARGGLPGGDACRGPAFIDGLPDEYALAVGPCRCRVGNRNCDHEIMTDIVIRRTAPIWYKELFPKDYRVITKQEAKEICRTSRKAGMIQSIDRHLYYRNSENYFVVCNCCKESCVPIIAYRLFKDEPYRFFPSRSVSTVDEAKCRACGTCIEACPFEERELVPVGAGREGRNGVSKTVARVLNCQGCGRCADVCEAKATFMIPREDSPLRDVKPW